jgi:hypothetical protein
MNTDGGRSENPSGLELDLVAIEMVRLADDPRTAQELVCSARFFEQVWTLWHLDADGRIATLPTGLVPEDNDLRAAIQRTWTTPTPPCWVLRYVDPSDRLQKQETSVGKRLSQVAH